MDDFQQPKEEAAGLEELKKRKEEILNRIKQKKAWLIKAWLMYVAMLVIAWYGYYIRTRNIPLLQGKWLPDVDSYAFLRYAEYIAAHGKMMAFDALRYYPFGFEPRGEFGILSYCIAYLGKILHIFNPNATTIDAAIFYPALSFFIAAVFFFLFVKKMFNYKVAIVASAFFAVIPAFLYRTMAGVADKEALAVALMFAAFYFYVSALKSEAVYKLIIFALLAGIFSGLMAAIWGGYVFMILALGTHAIICMFIGAFSKKHFYSYAIWMFSLMIVACICYPARFTLLTFTNSITSQIMLMGFLMALIIFLMDIKQFSGFKEKIEARMPIGLFALIATISLGILLILVTQGTSVISGVLGEVYTTITRPFATTRWQMTVAENHQPYFTDVIGQFSWKFILIFMAGAVLTFYDIIRQIRHIRKTTLWSLTAACGLFIILFSMSRYSPGSMFNGETLISQFAYIGSLVAFLGILSYGYVKYVYPNKEARNCAASIDIMPLLVFLWFIIMVIAARSAIRLLFIFAPVTAILAGYLAIQSFEKARHLKKDAYKIIAYILIIFIIGTTFLSFAQSSKSQASYVGPSYNIQWQNAMSWVRNNTPEDAIFAHWWDYGYWVHWGGNRTTISDGGNAYNGINHFVGRHILTAQSETEALEFMKSRNVSYLLIIKEEIGKYPAFSSIGADVNYDRYSWINTFVLRQDQTRETRNETVFLYVGGTPLDDDFVYQGKLYPAGSAGIGAFTLPIQNVEINGNNETKVVQKIGQPKAIIVYNGMQTEVPLGCIYLDGKEMKFGGETLDGCLRIMPTIEGSNQMNQIGAALYLSPDVYKGLFAKIFLLNQETEHIKLAYTDEDKGMPLALYQGQLIGPLKIWKITYPDNLTIPPEYYKNEMPDARLDEIKR